MINLPIGRKTFKRSFLSGSGTVELTSDGDSWATLVSSGAPFNRNVDDVASLAVKIPPGKKPLRVGSRNGVALTVSAGGGTDASIRLIWQADDELLSTYGVSKLLTSKKLFAALTFGATAEVSGGVPFPAGALSGTFDASASAGGHVAGTRLKLYDRSTPAKELLLDLLAAPILPQNIDSVAEIPAAGEVLSLQYGGYLNVSSAAKWGYSFAGFKSANIGDLDLDLSYTARAGAGLSLGYNLAGEFDIQARRGAQDGWIRLSIHKSKDSKFDFAADFGLDANFKLEGLPASADDFLSALLGTDARAALGYLQQATELSNLDNLEKKLDGLALGFLDGLAQKWLGEALADDTVKKFLEVAQQVVQAYNGVDQRIIELYETYLDKIPELTQDLDKLSQITSRDGFRDLGDSSTWQLLQNLYGDQIYDLLLDDTKFGAFRKLVTEAQDFLSNGAQAKLRQFIGAVKEDLGLGPMIQKLNAINSPTKLKKLTDQKVQGLVGRILGTTFDKIEESGAKKAFDEIHTFLTKVEDFKTNFYQKFLTRVTGDSLAMDINYSYTRASTRDALFDLEINLATKAGRDLARAAARGNFTKVLKTYDPSQVLIHKGVLTHNIHKSSQLQINVFGWGMGRAVDVMNNLQHSIEADPGGLIHVYTLESQIKQKESHGRRFKETRQSSFLLQAVGAALQPTGPANGNESATDERNRFLIQTLRKMGVQYDLTQTDAKTSPKELTQYLRLAELLALVPSREAYLEELEREFPQGFGAVKATYVVRYDDLAVRNVFSMDEADLAREAREAMRQLIASRYIAEGPLSQLALVGFAYLSPSLAKLRKEKGKLPMGIQVNLPRWFTGTRDRSENLGKTARAILDTLYQVENKFLKVLQRLDDAVSKALSDQASVPVPVLRKASNDFVKTADDLDKFGRENTFFAVFDHLVQEGNAAKLSRESVMILEITPPGGGKVTKHLMS